MNVSQLSHQQKSALVHLFTFVARADGKLDSKEWHYLNRYCEDQGLTYDINAEFSLADVCEVFDTKQAKMIALVATVKMALSDLEYAQSEQMAVRELASEMSIPQEIFDSLNQWGLDGLRWMQQGEQFIHG